MDRPRGKSTPRAAPHAPDRGGTRACRGLGAGRAAAAGARRPAAAAGNRELVRFLLDRGAKIEPERAQPAMLSAAAVSDDDPAVVELLLKRKARVDVHDA